MAHAPRVRLLNSAARIGWKRFRTTLATAECFSQTAGQRTHHKSGNPPQLVSIRQHSSLQVENDVDDLGPQRLDEDFLAARLLGEHGDLSFNDPEDLGQSTQGSCIGIQGEYMVASGLTAAGLHDIVLLETISSHGYANSMSVALVVKLAPTAVTLALLSPTPATLGQSQLGKPVQLSRTQRTSAWECALGQVLDGMGRQHVELSGMLVPGDRQGLPEPGVVCWVDSENGDGSQMPVVALWGSEDEDTPRGPFLSALRALPPLAREAANRRLHTGVAVLDAFCPLILGHSLAITGPHGAGKTALATQIIANQARQAGSASAPLCVYVAVGGSTRSAQQLVHRLNSAGSMQNTTVVAAPADSSTAAMQLMAPYVGLQIAEGLAGRGRDVLLVLDDLRQHFEAAQQVAEQSWQVPTQVSTYGPILDRAMQLNKANGGGSLTMLALAEAPDVAALCDASVELTRDAACWGSFPAVDVAKQAAQGHAQRGLLPSPLKESVQALSALAGEAQRLREQSQLTRQYALSLEEEEGDDVKPWLHFPDMLLGVLGGREPGESHTPSEELLLGCVALGCGAYEPADGQASPGGLGVRRHVAALHAQAVNQARTDPQVAAALSELGGIMARQDEQSARCGRVFAACIREAKTARRRLQQAMPTPEGHESGPDGWRPSVSRDHELFNILRRHTQSAAAGHKP